ncbi:MAG: hypothetical protein ABJO27_18075 [Pseudoruegeria sp.]
MQINTNNITDLFSQLKATDAAYKVPAFASVTADPLSDPVASDIAAAAYSDAGDFVALAPDNATDLAKTIVGEAVVGDLLARNAVNELVMLETLITDAILGNADTSFVQPDVMFAPNGDLEGATADTVLPDGVNGAFVPGEPGEPGTILLSKDLKETPALLHDVMVEELGEALGHYVASEGYDVAPGDVGNRVMQVIRGETPEASDFVQNASGNDVTTVKFNGEHVEAKAADTNVITLDFEGSPFDLPPDQITNPPYFISPPILVTGPPIWEELGVTEAEYDAALDQAEYIQETNAFDDGRDYLSLNDFDNNQYAGGISRDNWGIIVNVYGNSGTVPLIRPKQLAVAILDGAFTYSHSGDGGIDINFDKISNESLVGGIFNYIEDKDNDGKRLDQVTIEQIDAATNFILNDFHAIQADRDFDGLRDLLTDGEDAAKSISRSALLGGFKGGVLRRNVSVDKGNHVSITVQLDQTPTDATFRFGPQITSTVTTISADAKAGDVIGGLFVTDDQSIDASEIQDFDDQAATRSAMMVVDGQLILNKDATEFLGEFPSSNDQVSAIFKVRDADGNIGVERIVIDIVPEEPAHGEIGTGYSAYGVPPDAQITSSVHLLADQNMTGRDVYEVAYTRASDPDTSYTVMIDANDTKGHVLMAVSVSEATDEVKAYDSEGTLVANWSVSDIEASLVDTQPVTGEQQLATLNSWAANNGHAVIEEIGTSTVSLIVYENNGDPNDLQVRYISVGANGFGAPGVSVDRLSDEGIAIMDAALSAKDGDLLEDAFTEGTPDTQRRLVGGEMYAVATLTGQAVTAGDAALLAGAYVAAARNITGGTEWGLSHKAQFQKQQAAIFGDPALHEPGGDKPWVVIDVGDGEQVPLLGPSDEPIEINENANPALDAQPEFSITEVAGEIHQEAINTDDDFTYIANIDEVGNLGEFIAGESTFGIPLDATILSEETIPTGDNSPFSGPVTIVKYTRPDEPDKIYTSAINESDPSSEDTQLILLHAEYTISDGTVEVFDDVGGNIGSFFETDFVVETTEAFEGETADAIGGGDRNLQADVSPEIGDPEAISEVQGLLTDAGARLLQGTIQSYNGLTVANGITAEGDAGVMAVSYTGEAGGQSFTTLLEVGSPMHQAVRTAISTYAGNAIRRWAGPTTTGTLVNPAENMAVNLLASVASTGAELAVDAFWSTADYTLRQIAEYIFSGGDVAEWQGIDDLVATPVQTAISPVVYDAVAYDLPTGQERLVIVMNALDGIGHNWIKFFSELSLDIDKHLLGEMTYIEHVLANTDPSTAAGLQARENTLVPQINNFANTYVAILDDVHFGLESFTSQIEVLEGLRNTVSDVVMQNVKGTDMELSDVVVRINGMIDKLKVFVTQFEQAIDRFGTLENSFISAFEGVDVADLTPTAASLVRAAATELTQFTESHINAALTQSSLDLMNDAREIVRDYRVLFFGNSRPEVVSIDPNTEGYFVEGAAADWLETVIVEQNVEPEL